MRAVVEALDPDAVFTFEAPEMFEAFDVIVRLGESAKTLLARRVEAACTWKRAGYRSAAEQMAVATGTSEAAARKMLETSKQIEALPATADAMRSGRAFAGQGRGDRVGRDGRARCRSAVVGGRARAVRSAPRGVFEGQGRRSRCRALRLYRGRKAREYPDNEGAWNFVARGTLEAGARFRVGFDPIVDELFKAAVQRGAPSPATRMHSMPSSRWRDARVSPQASRERSPHRGSWGCSASMWRRCEEAACRATRSARSRGSALSPRRPAVVARRRDPEAGHHQGRRRGERHTLGAFADGCAAGCVVVAGAGVHERGVRALAAPRERPQARLGADAPDRARRARPALRPRPHAQDASRLGARRRPRQTAVRSTRRPAPPEVPRADPTRDAAPHGSAGNRAFSRAARAPSPRGGRSRRGRRRTRRGVA